jgi:N utilization substance protein B
LAGKRFAGRTLARSQALQLLFQAEASGRDVAAVVADDYLISDGPLDDYGKRLALGAGEMLPVLDEILQSSSTNWSVSRMPAADRCLLRVILYEMLEVPEVAISVSIDESVELAKAYGTDESASFVNGILGGIANRIEAGEDLVGQAEERLARRQAEQDASSAEDAHAEEGVAETEATDAGEPASAKGE